jgi:hypothetical protein
VARVVAEGVKAENVAEKLVHVVEIEGDSYST